MNIDGGNIQEVLDKALAGSGLSYRIEGNHIVIFQQPKSVTGQKPFSLQKMYHNQ